MDLILQGGAGSLEGSVDPKLGIVAIRLKCWAPDLVSAIGGVVPVIDVNLTENQPRSISRNVAGDVGGYDVQVTLEGSLSPDSAEGEEYSLDGSTSEDPIEAHLDLQVLLDLYDGKEDPTTGRATWPKTLADDAGSTGRNRMHGVESTLVPSLTWTRKSVSVSLPASIVRTLGTIDQPPGNPPELSGQRNWLKIRCRATWRGNVWQIEETWLLSGPDGWVPEMYRPS